MNLNVLNSITRLILVIGLLLVTADISTASELRTIRLGYLNNPGSLLCQIAAAEGFFRAEGLSVDLISYDSSVKGLAALETGAIDVGAFTVGDSLRAIAGGKGFQIIAGGGTPVNDNPLTDLDDTLLVEAKKSGVVMLIAATWPIAEKGTIIQFTVALIQAYRTQQDRLNSAISTKRGTSKVGHTPYHYDPNPDYWRLDRLWSLLGLQQATMKRDFLANHVYEEIYCDALERLLLGDNDPILLQLFSKAICTPDCCPVNAAKL